MKIRKFAGAVLAICLMGAVHAVQAQTTNSTPEILQMQTFREGLVWIGDKEPSEAENKELLEVLKHLDEAWWPAGVEQFLRDYPHSSWAVSLRHDYASYCRRTGRATKALEQWTTAWALVKNDTSSQGQQLAGTILANWTDLLSSLGRLPELKELVAVGDQWHFVDTQDRDKFQGAKNSYYLMQAHPGIAYRCGTFALKAVGEKLQPSNRALENLPEIASPTNGFSMAALVDMAKEYGLNMVAVRRTQGQELIVPSVVHWRQNHYAAILEQQDNLYLVNDPTFGQPKWLSAEAINEEVSGEFLIPITSQSSNWRLLARNETEMIHGMGLPNNIKDGKDKGRKPPCPGMPVWWVSEPYINLWLADEPLSYLTSIGESFTFRITYKQRDSRPAYATPSLFPTRGWNNSWLSFVHLDGQFPCTTVGGCFAPQSVAASLASLYLPNGGEVNFPSASGFYDKETRTTLQGRGSLVAGADYGNNGVEAIHADGSLDIYGLGIGTRVPYGDYPVCAYLLTRHLDPHGNTTWFNYGTTNFNYILSSVVDSDGRTNTLKYTSSAYLIEVDNPYGMSAKFKYDNNNNLTNIVDAAGLASSITYDTNGYPTKLITPYGTTKFAVFLNSTVADTNNGQGNFGGHDLVDRSVQVTDPVGATSLYLYRYDASTFMSTTYSTGDVPTNTPLGTLDYGNGSATNTFAAVCYRNSFYWGPRQYATLSTTNVLNLAPNDYLRGRMRHWLQDGDDLNLSGYVSVERDPSPDGSTEGLKTFYDYQGKVFAHRAGTNALPSVVAWRLPGEETHYQYERFDSFGNATNLISTSTPANGGVGTRTNQFIFANNIYTNITGVADASGNVNPFATATYTVPNLLAQVIGADGNTAWTFGFDSVKITNYFAAPTQTNGVISSWTRVLPRYATNGVGDVTTFTFTGLDKVTSVKSAAGLTTTNLYNSSGFLAQTIDLEIQRTNSFGYTSNGLASAFTNELGLNLTVTWDNLLRRTATVFPDGTFLSNRWDKLDLGGQRDRLGNWTSYGFDGARHLVNITNANNAVTLLSWCGCGSLTDILDPLTHDTSLGYDHQGNLTSVSFPDTSSINYQYDLAARRTSTADGAGRALRLAYNNQGLVTVVSNAFGAVQRVTFDILDRPIIITDENGVTGTNTFDALDRPLTRTWANGTTEGFGWSARGLAFYTNQLNQVTRFGRDAAGRKVAVTNANNEVVLTGYNAADDVTSLTDGLNHTVTFQFNEYGWQTNKTDGLNRTAFRYLYNANGWLMNRWTPEKGNTGYTYDNVGNLKSILYPQSSILYSFDALNRLTNMVDAVGTHGFTYTATGQLQSENGPWASDTVTYTYVQGLRTALTLSQTTSNWSQTYGFDNGWRMTSVSSPAGGFLYDFGGTSSASSLIKKISLPNGAYVTNSFDLLANLKSTALVNHWGHALDGYTYGVDALGLKTNLTRDFGLTTSSVNIGYDNIAQLTAWTASETNGTPRLNEQLGWAYDAANNLLRRTNNLLIQTFSVDAADELTSVARTGTFTLTGATPAPMVSVTVNGNAAQTYGDFAFAGTNLALVNGTNTFTIVATNLYGVRTTNIVVVNLPVSVNLTSDNNGNLTNDGLKTLSYDAENQLTNVMVAGQWKSEFVYDGLNRRRITRDYSWTGSAWVKTNETRLIYDGDQIIQERDTNNVPLVTYTRGLDLSGSLRRAGGIGGLLARTDTNGSVFYHQDGMGNITALMDAAENMVGRYLYGPFGKLSGLWGPMAPVNVMRFSSKPYYALTDDYDYGSRRYRADLQRWTTLDPSGEAGGINLYEAFFNSPTRYVDRNGRDNIYNMGDGNNAVPNITLSGPVGGGPVNTQYNGGGLGDPLFMLGGMTLGGMVAGGAVENLVADLGVGNTLLLAATIADGLGHDQNKNPCPPNNGFGNQPMMGMLGDKGTQTFSRTVWKGERSRIDVENPDPGGRPGQIHFQDGNNKWLYNPETDSFPGAPKSVNNLLNNPSFRNGIQKGLRYLGEIK